MGFLKKIGGALGKLPGSKLLTKPINKLAGKTPGLKGMPAAFGMGGPKKSPIAPSPAGLQAGMAAAKPAMGSLPGPGGWGMKNPPPMQGGLPQANAAPPPMMQPPVNEMPAMQAPPPEAMPMQQPMEMTGLQAPMEGPAPQMPPQMTPAMNNLKQRMGGNTGIAGGIKGRYPSGIGPRFMG